MAGAPSTSDILPPPEVIFGKSAAMQGIRLQLEKIAAANLPVLIQGESGTGKDILARLIHRLSPRASGPFVKINCPAIPATLMESELFGYERGAFTGANTSKPGRVEMAHKGTLFLDEISELDLALQSKLLQLLQDGQFCRIGAHEDKKVEVRVVCATNRQLDEEIEIGSFRSDLFYRINVLNLQVCPLRERAEDIPILVEYFVSIYNEKYNLRAPQPGPDLIRKLQGYAWPGNIRELENIVKRYIIYGTETVFAELDKPESPLNPRGSFVIPPEVLEGTPISLKKITKRLVMDLERQIIMRSLQLHEGNRKRTAQALKISYRALLYKIRDSGLPSRGTALRARLASQQPRKDDGTDQEKNPSLDASAAGVPEQHSACFSR